MAYSTEYRYPVHRYCVNFQNGLCTLSGVAVDPNGAACPRFTPRSTTKTLRSVSALPEARRPSQMYPSQMGQGRPFDRTMGGGRGLGGGRGMSSGEKKFTLPFVCQDYPEQGLSQQGQMGCS